MKTQNKVDTTTNLIVNKMERKHLMSFMRRYHLDRPFLRGMGNVVDIFATTYDLDFISKSDRAALLSDVQRIGLDMQIGITKFHP